MKYDIGDGGLHFLVYLLFFLLEKDGVVRVRAEDMAEFKGVLTNMAPGWGLKLQGEELAGELLLYRKMVKLEEDDEA